MFYGIDIFWNVPKIFFRCHPSFFIQTREINWIREGAERLSTIIQKIFMEIGHDEFADGFVHGFAVAEYAMVRLTEGSPASIFPEYRDDVIIITGKRFEIQNPRLATGEPQCSCREHGSFHAVRLSLSENPARRHARIRKIHAERPQKILDLCRSVQGSQETKFF